MSVFTRVDIYNRVRGGALIAWQLSPAVRLDAEPTFTVEASRSGVGDWEVVAVTTGYYAAIDESRWLYGKAPRLHYRVRFTTAGRTHTSPRYQIGANLDGRDAAILRDIVRKEALRFRQSGQCGFLYKRRHWGPRCTACHDYDTGSVLNSNCGSCFGTGYSGGYFPPVEFWLSQVSAGPQRRKAVADGLGVRGDRNIVVRALCCPWIDSDDVWVDFDSDQRYYIQTVNEVNYRGSIFLFDSVELRLAAATDIIYQLERPDDGSLESEYGD